MHPRGLPYPKSATDEDLFRRVGDMILPANDMRDAHFVVIDDGGKIIEWCL